jgi:hypothetical protein
MWKGIPDKLADVFDGAPLLNILWRLKHNCLALGGFGPGQQQ